MMGHIFGRTRGDFRILAHQIFRRAPDLERVILPVYFDGHTSRLFQLASHLQVELRMGLLLKEFRKRLDTPVRVTIGAPIPRADLGRFTSDTKSLMAFLRQRTYQLSPNPVAASEIGFEFD